MIVKFLKRKIFGIPIDDTNYLIMFFTIGLLLVLEYISIFVINEIFPKEALELKRKNSDERAIRNRDKDSRYTLITCAIFFVLLAIIPSSYIMGDPYMYPYNYNVAILDTLILGFVIYTVIYIYLDKKSIW